MKSFLKLILRGLVSNEETINGSKKRPIWVGLIVLLFSLIISVIPAFVGVARTQGSSIMTNTPNASLDTSLVLFNQYLDKENIDIAINDKGELNTSVKFTNSTSTDDKEYYVKAQDNILLIVRIIDVAEEKEGEEIAKYREMYGQGRLKEADKAKEKPYSYLILSKSLVVVTTYLNSDSTKNVINEDGTIKTNAKANASFVGLTKCAKGRSIKSFYNASVQDPIAKCSKNWKTFFNDLYKQSKTQYMWTLTGMLASLNLGVTLLLALVVMILTRLKSSTGDKLNYVQALNIISFSALSPALLTVIFGFLISSMAQIGFVLFLGLRATFLGMRAANPDRYQAQR